MPRLAGHLELTCSVDKSGQSYLSQQSFNAPFHISKPYWDGHVLVVQVVNPTAGLFEGDSLRSHVSVESRAFMHLASPSASRIHTMREGRAEVDQKFSVGTKSWLEVSPAPLIPQRNSRYRQVTLIKVAPGGELFFAEVLSPGRVAHGECFEFSEIDWECNLFWDHRLIARERFFLQPDNSSLNCLRGPFPNSYYASCYLVSDRISDQGSCWSEIRNLNSTDAFVGTSRLVAAGWSIKILARESLVLHRTIQSIRRILSRVIAPLGSIVRKL